MHRNEYVEHMNQATVGKSSHVQRRRGPYLQTLQP